MTTIFDVLLFKRMISPFLLQVLFWAGLAGTFYGVWVLYSSGHWAWWIPLLAGPIVVRVIFERAILSFRTYDVLNEIRNQRSGR